MKNLTLRQRQRIARQVSKTVRGRCEIDEQFVREIETGVGFTESHPVHARLLSAINYEKKMNETKSRLTKTK